MTDALETPGARMYEEFIAIHAILRRGTALVVDGFEHLAAGGPVDVGTLVDTVRWLIDFTHHHHESEDEMFWPVLRDLYPDALAKFDVLAEEHEILDRELDGLTRVVEQLEAAGPGDTDTPARLALTGASAARKVKEVLASHLATEEPVVKDLFPGVPGNEIDRLRRAIVGGGPRSGAHLVFGLLEDPVNAPGYDLLVENFPPSFRSMRPQLLPEYERTRQALGITAA
ncbi:hemerythrin domain-containing protein [Streptomyces sp. NPDC060322]|uniref:hemerythrin domain-containing protein n=1 Tax=unclassified Streptomyces TaxID=2593676 RepID=UPI003653723A